MNNLKIKIADLLGQPVGTAKVSEISEKISSPDPDNIKNEPEILGKVSLTKLESGILGSFNLKTKIALLCSRCLKEFKLPVKLKYEQEFSYQGAKQKNPDLLYTIEQDKLDILPSIQQEIMLAIPIKPLCDQNCKGIKI